MIDTEAIKPIKLDNQDSNMLPSLSHPFIITQPMPQIQAYARKRPFAYTVTSMTFMELAAELLPDENYRKGSEPSDTIPESWDGYTFDTSFTIGRHDDMLMMSNMLKIMNTDKSIIIQQSAGNDTLDSAIEYAKAILTTPTEHRYDDKIAHAIEKEPGAQPIVIAHMEIPDNRTRVLLHGDYYDYGTLSYTPLIPSMSFDFYIGLPEQHTCGISTTESSNLIKRWEYAVHCHIGKSKPTAKCVTIPQNNVFKKTAIAYKQTMTQFINFIDNESVISC